MKSNKTYTYAFDFDGVIAEYKGFEGAHVAGEPIQEVVETIRILKEEGNCIVIHSTRDAEFLKEYCNTHDIPADFYNENPLLESGNKGKPRAYVYIDDHALCYTGQKKETLIHQIKNFKTYWEEK